MRRNIWNSLTEKGQGKVQTCESPDHLTYGLLVIGELTKPFLLLYKALLKGFWTVSACEANQESTRLAMRRLRLRPKRDAREGA